MLTRRELIFKWSLYAAASLLLLLFCELLLRSFRPLGVAPFVPPLLVAVVASTESPGAGVVFALVWGLVCDSAVPGTFPCVYTLAFPAAALGCSAMARSVLQPGPLCSLAASALVFLVTDALNMIALFFRCRAPFLSMLDLAARETVVSCLLLLAVHPAGAWLHRRFTI